MSNPGRRVLLLAIPGLTAGIIVGYCWFHYHRRKKNGNRVNPKTCSSKLSSSQSTDPHTGARHRTLSLNMTCIEETTELSSSPSPDTLSPSPETKSKDREVSDVVTPPTATTCEPLAQAALSDSELLLGASAVSAGEENEQKSNVYNDGDDADDEEEEEEELVQAVEGMFLQACVAPKVAAGQEASPRKVSEGSDDGRSTSPTDSGVHMTTSPVDDGSHKMAAATTGLAKPRPLATNNRPVTTTTTITTTSQNNNTDRPISTTTTTSQNNSSRRVKVNSCSSSSTVMSTGDSQDTAPSSNGGDPTQYGGVTTVEFLIPNQWAALFIGGKGRSIKKFQADSNCRLYLTGCVSRPGYQVVVVTGEGEDVELALELVRLRFPLRDFPDFPMERVEGHAYTSPPPPAPQPQGGGEEAVPTAFIPNLQLPLPDGVRVEVIVSSIQSCGQFFVQQPTHPSYARLSLLDLNMNQCYSCQGHGGQGHGGQGQGYEGQGQDQPQTNGDVMQCEPVPDIIGPLTSGVMVAAPYGHGWFRAQVTNMVDDDTVEVRFSDYGGYATYTLSHLKPLRSDFLHLPLQANECYLANVVPIDESKPFSEEANTEFEKLCTGRIVEVQVVDWAQDGNPYVNLFRVSDKSRNTLININREMVMKGMVKAIDHHTY